jgi:hypothetical protein
MLDLLVNGKVRCRVLDRGLGFASGGRSERPGGWGLQVVEQLSDRWGMQYSAQQTEVWFERHCS